MNFASDNVTGACPEILAALIAANEGTAMPYGEDDYTQHLDAQFSNLFETEVAVFPVATGSAANSLALSVLSPVFGAIYCHQDAHINVDECGAPEFYTGGAKLFTLSGTHGKIHADALETALEKGWSGVVHHVQPAVVSITQATEAGTVYQIDEIKAIAQATHTHGLHLHMDGARFANAVVSLGCTPAEVTWKAGVDVLSFGATKNGAIAAEAVVFFNRDLVSTFNYRRKRGGHLFSKMRFLSAQLQAYLTHDLWLRNATHANQMAAKLARGLSGLPGITLCNPVEANEIFAYLPNDAIKGLYAEGFQFYRWEGEGSTLVRLVTAFNTPEKDVDAFITTVKRYAV
jgi:threonine aldolase